MSDLEDLRKDQIKDKLSKRMYPEVITPKKKRSRKYLLLRALLHLRHYFTPKELAVIFKRSVKYIKRRLWEIGRKK